MSDENKPKAKSERGEIVIGDVKIECYVLDDERRVVTQRGAVRALSAGKSSGPKNADLDRFVERLPSRFGTLQAVPKIAFDSPTGPALGRDAPWFVALCNAYVDAFFAGELHPKQVHIAENARAILSAAATVGFESMVDDATGYVPAEDDGPVARFVRHLFVTEPRKWQRFWPADVVQLTCHVFRIRQSQPFPAPMLGVIGKIYRERFGEHWNTLRDVNPPGPARDMHHQHFEQKLHDFMTADMAVIRAYLMAVSSKAQFWELWGNYVRGGGQLRLGW